MFNFIKTIWLILVHGYEGTLSLLPERLSMAFKDQINIEREMSNAKSEHIKSIDNFKVQMKEAIKQSEENEAIREEHFGPNPERTNEIKQRNKERWDKYFGENGIYK